MKKKGFTLIELLAVLVILAILALITIPIVLSIIRNAKENSYKRSIETYGRAVETAVMEYQMNNEEAVSNQISFYKDYIKTSKNEVECNDTIEWVNDSIKLTGCKVKGSNVTFKYENGKATKVENQQEEQINYTAYSVGDEITVAGIKFYIISNHNDYVVALKAESLTEEEILATGAYEGYTDYGLIHYGSSSSYETSYIKAVVDAWAQKKFTSNELMKVDNYDARLIQLNELQVESVEICVTGYCRSEDHPKYDWMNNTPSNTNYPLYWTMTPYTDSAFRVLAVTNVDVRDYPVDSFLGSVRPVINVYKSAIQN